MKAVNFFGKVVVSFLCLLLFGAFLSHQLKRNSVFSARQDTVVVEASEIKVTTSNLNMRTGPGTSNAVIAVIPKGATVSVDGYSGDWAKVTYNDKNGYAHGDYLKSVSSATLYTTGNLNMRTGPGTSYPIVLVLPKGAEVTVLDTSNIFYKISYGGKVGYSSSRYLTGNQVVDEPSNPAPPVENDVRYTTADLNLRSGPSASYSILLSMPRGSKVTILDTKNSWPRVKYGSKEGYASPKYLSTSPPSTLPDTSPSGYIS